MNDADLLIINECINTSMDDLSLGSREQGAGSRDRRAVSFFISVYRLRNVLNFES
jgi:hypothetical protein